MNIGGGASSEELERLKQELEKLRKELEELRNAHGQTIIKVNSNKEQIDAILARLKDIIKGDKEGEIVSNKF